MNGLEICLVIIGLIFVACSFLFSEHLTAGDTKEDAIAGVNVAGVTEEIVKREVEAEVTNIIDDKLDEMEIKAEKLTSEKIMALGEFSEDIQKRIGQNHDEVMFLYNMLNDKEEVLKNTIRDIEAVKTSVKKMAIVNDVAKDVTEKKAKVVKKAKPVEETSNTEAMDMVDTINTVEVADKTEHIETAKATIEQPAQQAKNLAEVAKKSPEQPKTVRKHDISNNNQMILKLYSEGKSNIEIAKELGLGIGEVRLVIDLFNSRRSR